MKKQYGLIGYPLGYSLSPALHNYFFSEEKIDASYVSHPLKKEQLKDLFESKQFKGFNVTIPYKEDVLPLCDELTETAQKIGAVNTVKLVGGKYIGTNTDAPGFTLMLKEEADFELTNKTIFLLGAGGAAKAITYSALTENCKKLFVYDISEVRTAVLKNHYANKKIETTSVTNSFQDIIAQADIIINATPIGMEETINQSILNEEQLSFAKKTCLVIDIIYSPTRTKLMALAESHGLKTLNGLGMLAGQGILGEKFWFSKNLRYNISKEILLRAIQSGVSSK
jgi:shikimate dehydrogenase